MATYATLDGSAEDALHANRLLTTEDKTYKRISKKLFGKDSPLLPPTPKASEAKEGDSEETSTPQESKEALITYDNWQDEIALELGAFEASIVKSQFLLDSNAQERERYAAEKLRILETEDSVRQYNDQLRSELADAQATLELRKTFDKLAEKITENSLLKPRDQQLAEIQQLHDDTAELEREGEQYSIAYEKRRLQFERSCGELRRLLRIIRDEEEEEPAHKEGTEKGEDEEDVDEDENEDDQEQHSGADTPAVAGDATPPQTANTDTEMTNAKSSRAGFNVQDIGTPTQLDDNDDDESDEGEITGDEGSPIDTS